MAVIELNLEEKNMIKIKKILVPTDLREQSLAGIKYAISLARDHDAEVLVLHVIDEKMVARASTPPLEEEMLFPGKWAATGEATHRFIDIELKERMLDLYSFLCGHLEIQDLRSVKITRLVRLGDIAEEIVSVAAEEQCDLIVMASQGKGWLARMIAGSMSEVVARQAPCPVLTIQPSAVVQENGCWIPVRSLVVKDAVSRA